MRQKFRMNCSSWAFDDRPTALSSACTGASRFFCRLRSLSRPLRFCSFSCRGRAVRRASLPRGSLGMPRQRVVRGSARTLVLQRFHARARARDGHRRASLAFFVSTLCAPARLLRRLPFLRRLQIHPRSPRFRQPYRDGLLRGPRAVPSFTDMFYLLADELPRLRRSRFSFAPVLLRPLDCILLWHGCIFTAHANNPVPAQRRDFLRTSTTAMTVVAAPARMSCDKQPAGIVFAHFTGKGCHT